MQAQIRLVFFKSSLISVFCACHYDKHFVNSRQDNQNFVWKKESEKRSKELRA